MTGLKRTIQSKDFLFFCVATVLVLLRACFVSTDPDPEILKHVGREVSLIGEIIKEPDVRDVNTRYTVNAEDSDSNVLLVSNRFPEFNYGDKVSVSGKIELPENFVGDTGVEFDYVSYLAKDSIHFVVYRPEIILVEYGGNPIFKFLFGVKNYFARNVSRVVPEPNSSLINGLIFGARNALGEDVLTQMKQVGLIHIVAISGYNVTVIAASILYLCSFLRKRRLGLILSGIFIVLFAIMVGLGSTVIRASIMAVIAIMAKYFGRPNLALRTLFVAGFLMLIWNPLLLTHDPSFQLSFMATLGLILFSPIVSRYLWFVTEKFGLREIVSSTLSVQLFLLPLLIKMSGIFSLVSFFINFLILPLLPLTMLVGFITGFIGVFGTFVSWPFGAFSYLLTEIILSSVTLASRLPFAYVTISFIPTGFVFLSYVLFAWVFYKSKALRVSPERSLESFELLTDRSGTTQEL